MMNAKRPSILLPGLLTILLLFAACSAPPPDQPPPAETPIETPAQDAPTVAPPAPADGATETPADVAAADPTAACPAATEGAALYVSRENGFCFLYPSDLTLRADPRFPEDAVQLTGAPLDPGAMESFALSLGVFYNGPADGMDSAQYAATWVEYNAAGMGLPQNDATIGGGSLQQTAATVGGQPAAVIDNLPGMMITQRGAFVIANGARDQITLLPQPQDVPELAGAANHAWDTITPSIVFFPPQRAVTAVRSADVCPSAAADTKLLLSEVGGYCFLYPADFDPDPTLPAAIVGGPELGPFGDFPSLRASLTVGGAYPLADLTPEQVLQPGPENNDPNSVVATTLAGYPAVTYDFVTGPWRQRNAAVVVDDRYYTFVVQPWDPDLFPQALPDVERLWNTASQSIAFFDPWR